MLEIILKTIGAIILILLGGGFLGSSLQSIYLKKYGRFGMSVMFTILCVAFLFKLIF